MKRKMKDSGIEWIGEIPEDWEVIKMRNLGNFSASGIDKLINPGELLVRIINYTDVYGNRAKILDEKDYMIVSASEDKIKNHIVEEGDLIFTPSSETIEDIGISALVNKSLPNTAFSYHVLRFRFNREVFKSYKKYLCNNHYVQNVFSSRATGSIRKTLNRTDFKDLVVFLPPIPDQQAIATFLDQKCSEIDHILEKTRESIEEYKKLKQSTITEAVTKGLNRNVEMKDSGVEWIGEIPEEWEVVRIKNTSWLKGRIGWQGLKSSEYIESGPFLITGTDFINGNINWDTCVHISEERFNEAPEIHIKEEDLLITKDGTIGKVAIVKDCPQKVSLNSGVMIVRNTNKIEYDSKFIYYVLLSDEFWVWFNSNLSGNSTIIHLYQEQFYNFNYVLPPLEEQKKVISYLDQKCSEIDSLISQKQTLLTDLEAYKKSLIFECVTGKREVEESFTN